MQGHNILDNALTAYEIMHYMKCKNKGKKGNVALKLGILKTFDRSQWDYLEAIQQNTGLSSTWISWIVLSITSVTYNVLVNHDRIGPISPKRGLIDKETICHLIYTFLVLKVFPLISENMKLNVTFMVLKTQFLFAFACFYPINIS